MAPLPGAKDFLDTLRSRYQVIILSDTFYEFADPLMRQLGRPTLFCHRLEVDADVAALFAESMMNLRPWDLWKPDGTPQPGTDEILATIVVSDAQGRIYLNTSVPFGAV